MKYLEEKAARCNYTGYVDKYVTYPPNGPLPLPEFAEDCDVSDDIHYNALIINPAFNAYRIWDTVSRRNSDQQRINSIHDSIRSYGMSLVPRRLFANKFDIRVDTDQKHILTATRSGVLRPKGRQGSHPCPCEYPMGRVFQCQCVP